MPNCLALQIDSKGAQIRIDKNADKQFAQIGEEIGYSLNISNSGSISADTVTVNDLLPAGTSFVSGSAKIDGVSYPAYDPAAGFPLEDMEPGKSITVTFEVKVN